jgi:hypothetical protein
LEANLSAFVSPCLLCKAASRCKLSRLKGVIESGEMEVPDSTATSCRKAQLIGRLKIFLQFPMAAPVQDIHRSFMA